MTRTLTAFALAGAAFALASVPPAAAQVRATRIEGERYATLRALAEYVDDGAQFALEEAMEKLGTRVGPRERALMTELNRFATQARNFHNKIDEYAFRPWNPTNEVAQLRASARRVNTRMRRVPSMQETFEDWDLVMKDIADIQRLVGGASTVDLRRPDPEWNARTGHEHPDTRPVWREDALRDQPLLDFRRMARELDDQTRRVLETATRQRADFTPRGDQMLVDLQHFSRQTAAIRGQADANAVNSRELGSVVGHLLEDSRRADASMRRARVYMTVWDEWAKSIQILEQMSNLIR